MTDLSPLLRAYEEGRCHIARLGVLVECITPTVGAQLSSLLLNSSSKPLEMLQLEVIGHDPTEVDVWNGLQRAVSTNTTLTCVYLSLLSAEADETAAALIKPFHGQVLRYKTPLQLKAAFLSVVEHGASSMAGSLDHMVLSIFFNRCSFRSAPRSTCAPLKLRK